MPHRIRRRPWFRRRRTVFESQRDLSRIRRAPSSGRVVLSLGELERRETPSETLGFLLGRLPNFDLPNDPAPIVSTPAASLDRRTHSRPKHCGPQPRGPPRPGPNGGRRRTAAPVQQPTTPAAKHEWLGALATTLATISPSRFLPPPAGRFQPQDAPPAGGGNRVRHEQRAEYTFTRLAGAAGGAMATTAPPAEAFPAGGGLRRTPPGGRINR